ncbi:MAG: putative bifunctional diguanylate cyclase/phosphodiesterase [Kineosporiaceae bacterium]
MEGRPGAPPRRDAAVRGLQVAAVALVAVFAAGMVARDGEPGQVPWLDLGVFNAVYLAAAAACLLHRPPARVERLGWRALGAAIAVNVGGSAYYSLVLARQTDPPYPSLADAFFLWFYVLTYAGVILLLRSRAPRFQLSAALDGLVAGLGVAAVTAAVALPRLSSAGGGPVVEVALNLAWPIADLVLIVVLVGGSAVAGARLDRRFGLVVAGLAVTAAADLMFLFAESGGGYVEGGPVDLAFLSGIALLALAAGPTRRTRRRPGGKGEPGAALTTRADRARVGWGLVALPGVAAVGSLAVLATPAGGASSVPRVLAAACVLAALARTGVTFREMRDLTDVHRQARTDDLTQLPNRRALYEQCEAAVRAATDAAPVALLLIDLDRFKEVNDSLGHAAGDALLVQVGGRVRGALRSDDVLARLGGDEFAVVLPGTGAEAAVEVAEAVTRALAAPFPVESVTVHVDASIGVAVAPLHAGSRTDLLRCADIAMYDAKAARSGITVFAAERHEGRDRLRTVEGLRAILRPSGPQDVTATAGRLTVHLQPQVALATGAIAGVEALVRWRHPARGLLLPGDFLPLVHAAGLTGPLAATVLDAALAACRQWRDAGHPSPVAVNLCAADVHDVALPRRIRALLDRHGLPPQALTVELTEDTLVADFDRTRTVLGALRTDGVTVSIDDFGTGFASLAYLRDLPVDELKLDRGLVRTVVGDDRAAAIVRHTVDLGHDLGMRLVAEGVEDAATADLLTGLGCDLGQGYHLATPMPLVSLLGWLAPVTA